MHTHFSALLQALTAMPAKCPTLITSEDSQGGRGSPQESSSFLTQTQIETTPSPMLVTVVAVCKCGRNCYFGTKTLIFYLSAIHRFVRFP